MQLDGHNIRVEEVFSAFIKFCTKETCHMFFDWAEGILSDRSNESYIAVNRTENKGTKLVKSKRETILDSICKNSVLLVCFDLDRFLGIDKG